MKFTLPANLAARAVEYEKGVNVCAGVPDTLEEAVRALLAFGSPREGSRGYHAAWLRVANFFPVTKS